MLKNIPFAIAEISVRQFVLQAIGSNLSAIAFHFPRSQLFICL